jgi:hypothetical protein
VRSGGLDCQMRGALPASGGLGRGDDRGDAHLLPAPGQHHKHLKSTNMLERLNEEIRRRTYVVRIFPNAASCCRLWRSRRTRTGSKPPATSTWRT